ncbi:MAG: RHS repeat domain-containing protein [Acutalibacteraceae bacterium]
MTHNGFSYNFTYDSWGNQTGVKVGSQSLVTYSYGTGTNHNKLNSITYGNGQAITYQYDAKQNITGIKYSGDSTWRFTYTYDRQGNVKTATDNIAGTKATLDGDRMEVRKLSDNSLVYSSVTADDGSVTETAFGKTYTRKTNDDSYTQSTGQTVKSGTVTSPGTATALSEKTDYFGRTLEKSVLAKNGTAVTGGVSTSYEYKSASAAQTSDRVNILRNAIKTGANTSATKDFSYTYDGNGNIKTVHQVNNDGGSTLLYTYHYDAANQLTRVDDKVQDLTVVYVYNEGGNLVSRTNYKYTTGTPLLLKRTWLYTYDSTWKDQLAYYDAKRIQYDTVGNPTSYNGWAFTWEAGRQLASMSKSGTDVAYQYNADGLRTKKTVTQSGASTVYEYLWNESRLVGQKVGNDAVRILYDANGEPVGFTVNDSASYFYVKNLQGDVLAIVDKTGAEKVSYVYDAYGQIVSMTGDATLQKLNPCTYRGYYYDAETGLYYLQSRYYNPEWGRFINADKTEVLNITNNVKQANLYIYAENNPINYIDSSGDFGTPLQWAMAIIGGIAGWFFGDYVAKWFGYRSGWKYWTIRSGVAVGGAVIFWFAGTALLKVATRFLLSNPQMLLKISSRFSPNILVKLLQILGYNPIGRMNKSFFIGFINSLFNKGKAVMPFSWVKAALDVARKYRLPIRIDNGHSGTSWNFIHLHIYKVHIRIPSNAIQYIRNYIKKWRL